MVDQPLHRLQYPLKMGMYSKRGAINRQRLLGPLETFRREVAVPIERYGRDDVAESLKRVIRPFLLRRLKSDPAVIQDLPPKQEMTVICTLTREQASLYQAAVDEALREDADHGGQDEEVRNLQIEEAGDRRRRVVGVQRREHEVARQRGLHRDLRPTSARYWRERAGYHARRGQPLCAEQAVARAEALLDAGGPGDPD